MLRAGCAQATAGHFSLASLSTEPARCAHIARTLPASFAHSACMLRTRHGTTRFASLTVDRISALRASCAHAASTLRTPCLHAAHTLRTDCRHAARSPWQDKFRKILSTFSAARTRGKAADMLCTGCRHTAHRLPACCAQPMAGQVSKISVDIFTPPLASSASLGRNALNGSKGKATACQGEGNAWLEWLGLGHIMVTAWQGKARHP